MGIQVIRNKNDFFGSGELFIEKPLYLFRPINAGAMRQSQGVPPSAERFSEHEDRTGTVPFILTVVLEGVIGFAHRYRLITLP